MWIDLDMIYMVWMSLDGLEAKSRWRLKYLPEGQLLVLSTHPLTSLNITRVELLVAITQKNVRVFTLIWWSLTGGVLIKILAKSIGLVATVTEHRFVNFIFCLHCPSILRFTFSLNVWIIMLPYKYNIIIVPNFAVGRGNWRWVFSYREGHKHAADWERTLRMGCSCQSRCREKHESILRISVDLYCLFDSDEWPKRCCRCG